MSKFAPYPFRWVRLAVGPIMLATVGLIAGYADWAAQSMTPNLIDEHPAAVIELHKTSNDFRTPFHRVVAQLVASTTDGSQLSTKHARQEASNAENSQPWNLVQQALEIVNIGAVVRNPTQPIPVYVSADDPNTPGNNEIPDKLWPDYTPPLPYIKNTTRNLQFNESQFIASPGAVRGATTFVTTSDGYTWAFMASAINAMWPYNAADYSRLPARNAYYAGNLIITPGPGVVKATANYKGQNIKFWANQDGAPNAPRAVPLDRYFIMDEWGNEYIMHASGEMDQSQVAKAFESAELPPGWTKEVRHLSEDMILTPAEGADGAYHYLIFRDNADNAYHQISWSDQGLLAAQIEGMAIWGSQTDNVLAGDGDGLWDDLMHGAGGNDTLIPGAGNDEIWGDAGIDTVVLLGNSTDYFLADYSDDLTYLSISGLESVKEIYYSEYLQFEDGVFSVEDFVAEAS